MQNVVLSLFMNGLMAALLVATMIYCWKLNARIKVLQDSKSELAGIIREFDECTQRATASIAEIHVATNRISENIQLKIDKANFLADDLQYMIEKGQKMSGKPDNSPAQRPTQAAQVAQAASSAPRTAAPAANTAFIMPDMPELKADSNPRQGRVRSRAEQEIISALGTKNPNRE